MIRNGVNLGVQPDTPLGRSGKDVPWTVCPVTLNALAFLEDEFVEHVVRWRDSHAATRTVIEATPGHAHPDLAHLSGPLKTINLRAWAHGRFTAEILIDAADGSQVRFVDEDFAGIGLIPATLLTALHGQPLAAYCDHPVFSRVRFAQSDGLGAPRSEASTIPVDDDLPALVASRRAWLLERHPAPTTEALP